ncbi:MAG: bacillithiol biosynthesis cysteine-adding enzyme BshC [Bacteroidota bacterium]
MFSKQTLALKNTSLFTGLFNDYINAEEKVKPFYQFHINKQAYQSYLDKNRFETVNRPVLVKALSRQAKLVENTYPATWDHIGLLEDSKTFTITTGHQLCLFTGPLYFIYKIASTINLAKTLKEQFPDKNFVPVYWMASEDHDFEEINHINTFGKKITWNSSQKGSVGEFSTEGLQEVIQELKTILGESDHAKALSAVFEHAYLKHTNLADATRFLVNELFGEYGLVTLDGNDTELKHLFKEELRKDIFENSSFNAVNKTIAELKPDYTVQVNPREINIFYKENQLRERIEKDGEGFKVLNTSITFTKEALNTLIDTNPEKLSPNVVLRPLYQQKILPNIAYVGGPGEIAYWLEYKHLFEVYHIALPVLMPRNFVMLMDKGTQGKLQKLNLGAEDTFKDGEELIKQFIKSHNDINLEDIKAQLAAIYANVLETVSGVDKTLAGTAEAEKQKAVNGIANIEQKINRALKQKSENDVNQIWAVKGKLFPNNVPQERYDNFSMYYVKYGNNFIKELMPLLGYDLNTFNYTVLLEN